MNDHSLSMFSDIPIVGEWLAITRRLSLSLIPESADRSMAYTMDAVLFSLVLLAGLSLAFVQISDGGEDISDQLSEQQLESDLESLVEIGQTSGALQRSTVYWDDSEGTWVGLSSKNSYSGIPNSHPLDGTFMPLERRNIEIGLTVEYVTSSGFTNQIRSVHPGSPSAQAVVHSETVVIKDDTNLAGPDSSMTVSDSSSFFAPDAYPNSDTYNTLTVYVIVWQQGTG